jgi:formylglycine-generating enzyme required for sulfatase activity
MKAVKLLRILCLALAMVPLAGLAWAEERIALVIGLGAYQNAPQLPNPLNDARAIAETFRRLGFDVAEQYDLDNRGLSNAIRDFGIKAQAADVAVVYYAGHGIQVASRNYLIPADARLERERDLVYEALPMELVLGELSQARKLGILILDACRNNPFVERLIRGGRGSTRSNHVQQGLSRIDDTPSDTLVAMATRADAVAEDGSGRNSPYTAALLEHLAVPGLELSLFFRRVRDSVLAATNGRQEPYTFGSLGAEPFYFNPLPPNRPPEIAAIAAIGTADNAAGAALNIPVPTDPDNDRLFAQVAGLPRGGAVKVGERIVLIGDFLTTEQLAAATFKPDGSFTGNAGSFDFTVMDGRGGATPANVRIRIDPSNRAPIAAAESSIQVVANPLRIEPPADPDGDPVTIVVKAVPKFGKLRDGSGSVIRPGDRLTPTALAGLAFDPEAAPEGDAGSFEFTSEDGRGGTASSVVHVRVVDQAKPVETNPETVVWRRVQTRNDLADMEAYLRLFPDGQFASQARTRLAALTPPSRPGPPPAAAKDAEEVEKAAPAASADKLEPVRGLYEVLLDSNVRREPNARSDRAGRVEHGANVMVTGKVTGGNWFRIETADGITGFIHGDLIRVRENLPPASPATAPPAMAPPAMAPPAAAATSPPAEKPAAEKQAAMVQTAPRATVPSADLAEFQDCPNCPVMVRLPPGSFTMGSNQGDPSERPAHKVTLARPVALGKFEVTVGEWRACVDAGGCTAMPRMNGAGDRTPVHNISWNEAQQYVTWLARATGQPYRLPSETEWEYGVRGGTTTRYWWGNDPGFQNANCEDCGGPYDRKVPVSAGSFTPNPFKLMDMNGSVAEWVADCWFKDYNGAPADGSARVETNCRKRVLRGGSWREDKTYVTSTARMNYDADVRYFAHGLRVARDLR